MKVAVILSTYNGERFLREQLDSIINQTGVEVDLFVRDDGSADGTKDILTEYAQKNGNIHLDFAENVGVGNSFMNALYSVPDTYDYYAFADQDDIWQNDKLYNAAVMIEESNAYLYASNQECTDKDMNSLGLRYSDDDKINLLPFEIMQNNMLAGCTMVMSKEFVGILKDENRRPTPHILRLRMHDVWVAFVAALYGKLVYDKRSFIKYRQHESNVVGAKSKGKLYNLKTRINKLFNKQLRNGRSSLAALAVKCFPDIIDKHPEIADCADGHTFGGKKKILNHSREIRKISHEKSFTLFLKIIFGMY